MNAKFKNNIMDGLSFRVISTSSQRSKWPLGPGAGVARLSLAMIFCLFGWFSATIPAFAESYPNRPTVSEMNNIVVLGTECMLGVNERCYATQYQTNPVVCQVAPFTNTTFYLDQSLMGAMATKIRSLVQFYVDPDTVFDGTTNLVLLTVPGIWADLEIGDYVGEFTAIPAIGANPPTYGDEPWWICAVALEERYKVVKSLKCCRFLNKVNIYDCAMKAIGDGNDYADSVLKFAACPWMNNDAGGGIHAYMDSIGDGGSWRQDRVRGKFEIAGGYTANLAAEKIEAYAYLGIPPEWTETTYYGSDAVSPGQQDTYVQVITIANPVLSVFPYRDTTFYGNSEAPIPDGTPSRVYGWFFGWEGWKQNQVLITFSFQYCVNNIM